jgi:hypothetical protein
MLRTVPFFHCSNIGAGTPFSLRVFIKSIVVLVFNRYMDEENE